ncbi:hypothetical protein [Gordonia sp. (in: high G+C Gram-positive bacteria)]|mgnify:CR=1 FL=1|jgi:hypothetical protein|uniref:hypothetical protein n=1 Tax=Gordonia sp. (in: high G+C Gram-positive bacteria) TaxID=84139 RepID=UPI001DE47FE3|nr:hypothetical protein [Gordonia sp. (in: high G+C Gram-positive bacteria)]MCB1293834.1 hypothetical protein [Gordonia sp. (in: high G+C Gram-positive bacteria)]HMS75078.1 hypothetical protein [Gordonia sp. (in: high G+C Gram-positive bacteria)]HQV20250.1 hypothetical protein [Gordonia sp. (in: high G+C Gram-positive bacteria)]
MSAPTTTRKQRQKANKARGQAERARSILDELAAQHAARAAQSSADDGPEDAPATSTPDSDGRPQPEMTDTADGTVNRDDFFDQTDQLKTIRQWARARYAAPWAVFGAVMLRVAASTGPEVQLPGVIGDRASLNLMAAFVSASGGGKGISDKVARLAWPTEIHEEGIGSGEGIAALFTPPKDDDRITRAIVSVPEIDTLTGLAQRQGNTILATLKAAAMGERLGSKGASSATSRRVDPHSYRLCLSVGGQPGHTGVLFDDTTGGTPQRFLWFLTTDPDMPADGGGDPDPLDTTAPSWRAEHDVVEIVYGPPEIREQIIGAHLARQRGESDALDGHAMLTRCKVAGVLAIMHGRSVVSALDWELSGVVMDESDRVREWLLTEARRAAKKKVRDRAISRAMGEEIIAERRLERAKAAVLRWLERDGELASRDLRPKLKADIRDQFTAALAELEAVGDIVTVEVANGKRYRLSQVHAVPEVQPPKPQVRHAVPEVQRVPEKGTVPTAFSEVAHTEPVSATAEQTALNALPGRILKRLRNGPMEHSRLVATARGYSVNGDHRNLTSQQVVAVLEQMTADEQITVTAARREGMPRGLPLRTYALTPEETER